MKRVFPFVPLIFFIACGPYAGEISPSILTAVVQTQTATIWTPTPVTPSATPEPNTSKIVEILNNAMMGVDPLAETIEAKFSVIDVLVIPEPPTNVSGILRIHVECEWIYSDGCTLEKTFVTLMNAFTKNDKTAAKIVESIPVTVHTLQVVAFERMIQQGMIAVNWQDVLDYTSGKINGNQLGSRIVRMVGP